MTAQAYGAKGYKVQAADELEDVLRQCQQNKVSCTRLSCHCGPVRRSMVHPAIASAAVLQRVTP
jgi:thiamine pyrophosphate-dependent acetolactate synthase large subunit-like protein